MKLDLEKLNKLRDEQKKVLANRMGKGTEVQVVIGMATCGIAAGAREAMKAFQEEFEKKGITNAVIKQTGCLGLCAVEPTVEIVMPGMPTIVYGKVTPEIARDIVFKHIFNKKLLHEQIYDKPAPDSVIGQGI